MSRSILLELILGYIGICAAGQVQDNAPERRAVTVADAITMTQTGDPAYLDFYAKGGNVGLFSPDGSKFAFVTQKGNLSNDTVEFSLLVFRTADALTSPHPVVIATLASSSNREAISHVTWLRDNDALVFLGEHPGETPQLYRVSYTTKRLEKLSNQPTPILAYSLSDQGDAFVYVSALAPLPLITNEMRRSGFAVTSPRWEDLYDFNRAPDFDSRREIFVKTKAMDVPRRLPGVFNLGSGAADLRISVSPDGHYALLQAFRIAPPKVWSEYQIQEPRYSKACYPGDAYGCPLECLLVDLDKETIEPLFNAPVLQSWGARALESFAWTPRNSVLLVNALLPLDAVDAEEREQRRRNVYVAEIMLPGMKIVKIAERQTPLPAFDIQSDANRGRFVSLPMLAIDGPPLEFSKNANGWRITELRPSDLESVNPLYVTLEQAWNSPPKLVARDPKTKQKAVLLDLNPQFAQLSFGRVEIFRWKTPDGHASEGTLYYPPNYVAGTKYPLIIQTHGTSREHFWIDGPFSTASAAQPLANKGFLVVQMEMGDPYDKDSVEQITKLYSTPKEGQTFVTFFESAIEELDRRGLIDRHRVGVTGFSRTVYHVLYALTHSNLHVAAAIAADGVNFGYVGCLFYMVRWNSTQCEKMNGSGPPYGASLSGWAEAAPTFRLDKVEAPLLLQAISAPLGEWEVFAGLRWLKKPVELLNFYPEGEHSLVRPWQRLLSQGSVVDWYCFWIKGEEDPDPAKAEQYKRWRELRKLQERTNQTPKDQSLN